MGSLQLLLWQAEFERILEVPEAARALEEVGVDPVSVAPCFLKPGLSLADVHSGKLT